MKRLLPVALLLVPTLSAFAQDVDAPKEVKALEWMVGTWTGGGKIAFGGRETEIACTMNVSFDGHFLKAVSVDKSAGFEMKKTSMIGWDADKGEYVSYTFTNMASTARIAHGKLDGDKLVMVSDPWKAEGMTMLARETLSKISDTKCGSMLEMKSGDKWLKGMDFVLTKK